MKGIVRAGLWYWHLNERMWNAIKPYGFAIIFIGIAIFQVAVWCKS